MVFEALSLRDDRCFVVCDDECELLGSDDIDNERGG